MSVNLSAFAGAGAQFFDNNGVPLSGGLIYTYVAGTTTPQTTYTTSVGNVAHANPIVLDAAGRVTSEIWLTGAASYKFVLKDSLGVTIGTYDNISGVNDFASFSAPTGAALINYTEGGAGSVTRTVQDRLRDFVTVEDFGAVGNGTTDDTAAIQAAINSLTSGQTLVFDRNYKVNGALTITNKTRIRLTGKGRVFLSGAASGSYLFQLVSTCDDIEIDHLTLAGDNNSGYTQTAIGCNSGQTISNTRFHDLNISNINVGISHNANLSGSWTGGLCYNNTLDNILGTVSGSGYGIQMAKATRIKVYGNTINNCGRHSIYQAAGINCGNVITENLITNHRSAVYDGSFRAAIVVARSSDVLVSNNIVSDYYDCGMEIAHVTSDSANCYNISVVGNKFTNRKNAVPTLFIGEQGTASSYTTYNVLIANNTFEEDITLATGNGNILMLQGKNITIRGNTFRKTGVTSVLPAAIDVGYYLYTTSSDLDQIVIENNTATANAAVAGTRFVYIADPMCGSTGLLVIRNNTIYGWAEEMYFNAALTNTNTVFKFRTSTVYDFGSVSANSSTFAAITINGVKRTSNVAVRPEYGTLVNGLSYIAFAKSDADNAVIIEAVNSTGSPINPASTTFVLYVEDANFYTA